ncbi:rod shape-determining protein RodA [Azospirillum doebereinerae]|uniref:Peptidoglycan glycosyltransferase MrdB n=1 Tax=Azospirillum doebereinerae TaxID=92933 RepID=A0A3S0X191_9PROT|nr:rod shape-determining protein RodA [Azospirillum doebereinerae]MCG5238543.1 rod shape-determining protein RodA [Azospirillum doebereinerae]RUQ74616.1 rod shape-determining protein RodA [Azospirillum doebereinerae]
MVAVLSSLGSGGLEPQRSQLTLGTKFRLINWGLVLLVATITSVGVALLYSAAGGHWKPWAQPQLVRAIPGFVLMLGIAMIDVRHLMKSAYVIFFLVLCLLIAVELMGRIGMGAQRWIDLGFFQLQPSELMKPALTLALARYFHGITLDQIGRPLLLIPPLLLVFTPVAFVLMQPNLGTSLLLIMGSGAVFFAAGVRIWKFLLVIGGGVGAVPVAWEFLHDYQKQRVYTFLDPETDPLGAGYNILQSKIALGSGGLFGKGFMSGSQSQLMFLPEKHTDFIFVVLAEEFGMAGALALLALYLLLLIYGVVIALSCRSQFARLVAVGMTAQFFLYVFVNVSMVMGLIPVVGIPLPLVSYGGSAMLTLMIGVGLLLSMSVHREIRIPKSGVTDV